jgi:hypothetical protein
MIKSLNKSDILVTPFEANKNWDVDNLNPSDLILWMSQSIDLRTGITSSLIGNISLTYIDYGDNNAGYDPTVIYPITNSYCNLALQQQSNGYVTYRKGVFNQNIIYPTASFYTASSNQYNATENPINVDGTYMNIVYSENKHLFYNNYNNFTKTFGMETADLSSTHRILTDTMDVFTIPQKKFGEKLVPNSIKILDDSLDKEYSLIDDGNCNLIFSGSVFSKYEINNLLSSSVENLTLTIESFDCISEVSYNYTSLYTSSFGASNKFYVYTQPIYAKMQSGVAPYEFKWIVSGDNALSWTLIETSQTNVSLKYNDIISSYNDLNYQNTYVSCQVFDALQTEVFSNVLYLKFCG